MKTTLLTVLTATACAAATATADVGVNEATGAFTFPGSGSPSYVSAIGAGQNPRLNGYSFGSINSVTGESLTLWNWYFENYAYNGGSTPPGAATNNNWLDGSNVANLVVTISQGATQVSQTTFFLTQTAVSGNNRFWQLAGASQGTNLAAGLANGSYTVTFNTFWNFNQWTGSVSQVSTNTGASSSTFTVVPAPGALALLGVAGLAGARRRR